MALKFLKFLCLTLAAFTILTLNFAWASEKLQTNTIPPIAEKDLKLPEADAIETAKKVTPAPRKIVEDAAEDNALRISPDKPEIVKLPRDAVNVIVGSNETLRVIPDTNRVLILQPRKPGATYFKALDIDGKIIMQRPVIVGIAPQNYIRIRRTCNAGDQNCREFSVYYCPDMCHEVNVVQGQSATPSPIPSETVASRPDENLTELAAEPAPVLDEAGNKTGLSEAAPASNP